MPIDYRFDPFTNTKQPLTITNERQVIPTVSPYKIRLNEVPQKDSPSSLTIRVWDALAAAITSTTATTISVITGSWFSVGKTISIDNEQMYVSGISTNTLTVTRGYNGTTANTHLIGANVFIEGSMTEVAATPSSGQFWPDYSATVSDDPTWNTGTLLFNSTDAGKRLAINYKGLGGLVDGKVNELSSLSWLYNLGNGSDGVFVSNGNSSLTKYEYNFTDFVLNSGHTLSLSGIGHVIIRCSGSAIIAGTISALYAGFPGGAGGVWSSSTGPTNGSANGYYTLGGGGAGGGANGGSQPGGSGGGGYGGGSGSNGSTPPSSMQNVCIQLPPNIFMAPYGSGGGGGTYGSGGVGGPGGTGGGGIFIIAKNIIFTGTINASGAPGGNYSGTFGCGGGGGGGGVVVMAAKKWVQGTGSIYVAGGSGGTGNISNGATGGAGWVAGIVL
ncbi:MAG: hypothetical protein P4N41_18180 [Negativicutes bacterium]|nr:hypothetical protein [Negativicutes bacterium]